MLAVKLYIADACRRVSVCTPPHHRETSNPECGEKRKAESPTLLLLITGTVLFSSNAAASIQLLRLRRNAILGFAVLRLLLLAALLLLKLHLRHDLARQLAGH